jgi:hypothetical protein
MCGLVRDLLQRETCCEVVEMAEDLPISGRSADRTDVVVVDAATFPQCCRGSLAGVPRDRFVVVGPEPGEAYRDAAAGQGAGAWIPRERLGEDLVPEVVRLLSGSTDADATTRDASYRHDRGAGSC